jgi:hypothetical protein
MASWCRSPFPSLLFDKCTPSVPSQLTRGNIAIRVDLVPSRVGKVGPARVSYETYKESLLRERRQPLTVSSFLIDLKKCTASRRVRGLLIMFDAAIHPRCHFSFMV